MQPESSSVGHVLSCQLLRMSQMPTYPKPANKKKSNFKWPNCQKGGWVIFRIIFVFSFIFWSPRSEVASGIDFFAIVHLDLLGFGMVWERCRNTASMRLLVGHRHLFHVCGSHSQRQNQHHPRSAPYCKLPFASGYIWGAAGSLKDLVWVPRTEQAAASSDHVLPYFSYPVA